MRESYESYVCFAKEPIESSSGDRSLFAFAAQCNFSGYKHPLEWLEKVRRGALNGTSLYQLPQGSIGSVDTWRIIDPNE